MKNLADRKYSGNEFEQILKESFKELVGKDFDIWFNENKYILSEPKLASKEQIDKLKNV